MRVSRLLFVVLMLCTPLARGSPFNYEFLLLPSAQGIASFDRQARVTQPHDEVVQADMIFSLQKGPFKVFGEYLVSDHESDLERLQLGWQLSDETILWIGRFHQPTSVWNHDHHHGQYLQTSITRPGIDEWEDLGGVIPQHFTGALLESGRSLFGSWKLRTAVAAGIAPSLVAEGLEPYDLLHPNADHPHRLGYQARASLHPGELTETGAGIVLADDRLAVADPEAPALIGLNDVEIRLIGVFATYAGAGWKLTGTIYNVDTWLNYTASRDKDNFIVGYIEAERRLAHELTAYVRWEDSRSAASSPYLRLFEQVSRSRRIAGLRWDFVEHQALSVQFAKSLNLDGHYDDIRLQWSAAFF